MLLNPLIAVLLLWLMKLLIDEVFVARRMDLLPTFAVAYAVLIAGKLVMDYVLTRLEFGLTEQINQNIRVDLYRHLISVSPGSLRKYGVGDLLSHLSGDVDRVEFLIYSGPVGVIFNILTAIFFICFLFILSWKLTLCALLTAPLLALLSWRLSPRVRRAAKVSRRKATAWVARAEERLGALPIVHAFDGSAVETAAIESRLTAARLAELRTVAIQARLTLLIEAAAAIGGFLILGVGAYEMDRGSLTVGTLVAFLGSVGSLYSPISSLAKTSGRFQRAAAGAQRVVELLDTPSLVAERPAARQLTQVRGALEFSKVHFAYPGGPEVLHGVSFRIDPGETVAVVGPNGSGKSTLVHLALRLYDPSQGAVLIDGTDLREVTLASLRRAITVVFQEPTIFRGSISENIRYGRPEASDESFAAMAQAAHVDAFARALPRSYFTPVGPRGSWLSGGQRQRLALARAFLREAPILLLDEATASVDSEAEQLIQDALERFAGERTILLVSHRLSSVQRADRVVVLDEGQIVEMGSPAILQRTENPLSRAVCRADLQRKGSGLTPASSSRIKVGTRLGADLTVLGVVDDRGGEPIYLVWHHKSWCPMACKVFNFPDEAQREAEILLALAHPNIVRCFGVNGSTYLLMEFLEGPTLNQLMHKRPKGRLGIGDAIRLAIHIGAALRHIHEIGLLHLDVKPSNVIVVKGRPILCDFGIARWQTAPRPKGVRGTGPYVAPEECLLESVTPAADVFGLGVTLYELLTGNLPFSESTEDEQYPQVLQVPATVRRHRPRVPAALEKLVLSCLSRNPTARPNLLALLPALHDFVGAGSAMWPAGFRPDVQVKEL